MFFCCVQLDVPPSQLYDQSLTSRPQPFGLEPKALVPNLGLGFRHQPPAFPSTPAQHIPNTGPTHPQHMPACLSAGMVCINMCECERVCAHTCTRGFGVTAVLGDRINMQAHAPTRPHYSIYNTSIHAKTKCWSRSRRCRS